MGSPTSAKQVRGFSEKTCKIPASKGSWVCPVESFYASVAREKPVAIVGSSGFLEIAVNGGSAAEFLGLRIGTRVRLED